MKNSEREIDACLSIEEVRKTYYPNFSPDKVEPVSVPSPSIASVQMAAELMKGLRIEQLSPAT